MEVEVGLLKIQTQSQINTLWIISCTILIFLMQAGFMCLEVGLARLKNNVNVAIKNIVDFGLAAILFWSIGFGLMFGKSYEGLFGTDGFFFSSAYGPYQVYFVYQTMFVATAVTLVSGAITERVKFEGYLIITLIIAGIIYPITGHWAWNSEVLGDMMQPGWLRQKGFYDYAGSTIVHSVGGWVAFAALSIIGPRLGRYSSQNKGKNFYGNYPLAVLGVIILWFGWFGFNGATTGGFTTNVTVVIINTLNGGAFGLITSIVLSYILKKKIDPRYLLIGPIAGLVSVTGGCNIFEITTAPIIGAAGSILAILADNLMEKYEFDDVVSVVPVHLVGGIWGTLAVGLFGNIEDTFVINSRMDFIKIQLLGIISIGVFAYFTSYILLKAINKIYPLRVNATQEEVGLNVALHDQPTLDYDLIKTMETQTATGDLNLRAQQDMFTNFGIIGIYYNKLLNKVQEAEKDKEKWRSRVYKEMILASEVQRNFVPKRNIDIYPVHAHNLPAGELSGDFYDFYPHNDRIHFMLADVAGKGINAAMVMAKTITLFEMFAKNNIDIDELSQIINNDLYQTKTRGIFVTAIIGYYDLKTKDTYWVNSGHQSPIIKDGKTSKVYKDLSSTPLGLMNQKDKKFYKINKLNLDKKSFFAYTDGLSESPGHDFKQIGDEGVCKMIDKTFVKGNLKSCIDNIISEVTINKSMARMKDKKAKIVNDDITILAVGDSK